MEAVLDLARMGYYESDEFDFKAHLPVSADEPGRSRLRKTCAAFANCSGGFLIFGMKDDRLLTPEQRLVGLSRQFDFPVAFGNYPRGCVPSVEWSFKNPPIALPNGNALQVVHIPRSWRAPHTVPGRDGGLVFPKRTNATDSHGLTARSPRSSRSGVILHGLTVKVWDNAGSRRTAGSGYYLPSVPKAVVL